MVATETSEQPLDGVGNSQERAAMVWVYVCTCTQRSPKSQLHGTFLELVISTVQDLQSKTIHGRLIE